MKFSTVIFFLFFYVSAFPQYPEGLAKFGKSAPVVFDTVFNVVVLPNDLLGGNYDFVISDFPWRKNNVVGYCWNSWHTDGQYNLKFTPRQMILYTGHENPNPNRIYWVAPITSQQYERLKAKCKFDYKGLKDHKGNACFDRSYENFSRLLTKINKKMGNLKFEIPSKEKFESTNPVYLNPDVCRPFVPK